MVLLLLLLLLLLPSGWWLKSGWFVNSRARDCGSILWWLVKEETTNERLPLLLLLLLVLLLLRCNNYARSNFIKKRTLYIIQFSVNHSRRGNIRRTKAEDCVCVTHRDCTAAVSDHFRCCCCCWFSILLLLLWLFRRSWFAPSVVSAFVVGKQNYYARPNRTILY